MTPWQGPYAELQGTDPPELGSDLPSFAPPPPWLPVPSQIAGSIFRPKPVESDSVCLIENQYTFLRRMGHGQQFRADARIEAPFAGKEEQVAGKEEQRSG